ncbi:MAG: glycerate kinase type-2 family protein [Alphaproteobacteria bacterium]
MIDDPRQFLNALFDAAVHAARADVCLAGRLPAPPKGRTVVIGAGKAAAAMAAAVEDEWQGELSGLVITPYDHDVPTRHIEVVQASHPVPDEAGTRGAQRVLDAVKGLTEDDLVLCLISGGGSALLALPAPGVALEDKQTVTKALLRSGATIHEMNCVRKHLSAIKGGRLGAAAAPARVVTLAISDVPGDDISVIASGPTVADPSTREEALALIRRYRIDAPESVLEHLQDPASETPKPGDPSLFGVTAEIIATPRDSLQAAAALARKHGVTPVVLGDTVEGEARDVALVHAAVAREVAQHGRLAAPPAVILSGGETTVTLRGAGGSGGRNQEFLLALASALLGTPCIHALACDTDGIDGFSKAAGAVIDPTTPERAASAGINLKESLERQDSGGFFSALGDTVVTGPTRTNVNDFRAILVTAKP